MATLSITYYNTPTLLCNAAKPTQTILNADNDPSLTDTPWWSVTDNVLTIYPNGYYGQVFVTVTRQRRPSPPPASNSAFR